MPTNRHLVYFVAIGVSLAGYFFLGYEVERFESGPMVGWYLLIFGAYIYILYNHAFFKASLVAAFVFRLLLIASVPELSTDFFRFLWDGQLIVMGINPYIYTPDQVLQITSTVDTDLYESLAYSLYHSMYAPVAQVPGIFAAFFASDNVRWGATIMRLFVLLAETGSIVLMVNLLKMYRLPKERALIYAANPLVILELTANLHHEVYVVFFVLLFLYLYKKQKVIPAAVALGMAVLSKLLPVIFLPILIRRYRWRFIAFALALSTVVLIGFMPFWNSDIISGHLQSGALYFNKLEFNGSIYFLVRKVGFWYKGYNIIQTAGFWLGISVMVGIGMFALLERVEKVQLPTAMLWTWLMYVAFTTTLHPWYIIPLVAISVFTHFRFPVVWSLLIFFTYLGYTAEGYYETPYVFVLEYLVTYGWMLFEIRKYASRDQVRLRLSGRPL